MPEGWRYWLDWQHVVAPDNQVEIEALTTDQGRYLGYVRAIAHRRADRDPDEPISAVPVTYTKRPVYRQ